MSIVHTALREIAYRLPEGTPRGPGVSIVSKANRQEWPVVHSKQLDHKSSAYFDSKLRMHNLSTFG